MAYMLINTNSCLSRREEPPNMARKSVTRFCENDVHFASKVLWSLQHRAGIGIAEHIHAIG